MSCLWIFEEEYKKGATATFVTSTGEYPGTNRLEISGTYGKAVAEDGVLKLYLLHEDEREIRFSTDKAMPSEKVTKITLDFPVADDGHILILQNFTNHILNGEELIAPGEEGIKSLRISNAAYVSSWTKVKVMIPCDEVLFTGLLKQKKLTEKSAPKSSQKPSQISKFSPSDHYSSRWSVRW